MTNSLEKHEKERIIPKINSFCFVGMPCIAYPITRVEDGRYFVSPTIVIPKGLALIVIKGRPRGRCTWDSSMSYYNNNSFRLRNVAHVVSPEYGELLVYRQYMNIPE